jgi:hypothetical protein
MVTKMKPTGHITRLIDAISDNALIQKGRARQIISVQQYTTPMSLILHEGSITLYRGSDNLMITTIYAPFVVGVNFLVEGNSITLPVEGDSEVYLQARTAIRYEFLPRSHCEERVRQLNLWESIAYVNMFISKRYIQRTFANQGASTYNLVRNNLLALMNEDESLRQETNACDYIHEKTLLSRSGIMKMLSDLKKGGHIEMQRGVLISIKKLPSKY